MTRPQHIKFGLLLEPTGNAFNGWLDPAPPQAAATDLALPPDLLNPAEAYGRGTVLEQTLGLLAFGIPQPVRPGAATPPAPGDADDDAPDA